jgi:translocator protein
MSSFIFPDTSSASIFFVITVMTLADLFIGQFFRRNADGKSYAASEWYIRAARRVALLPPRWVFMIIWPILKVLIISAMYIFYRDVNMSGQFGETYDAVTLLFAFNMAANAFWFPIFFDLHQPLLAFIDCLVVAGTGAAILWYFTRDDLYWTSFWIFLLYPIWSACACVFNLFWLNSVENHFPPSEYHTRDRKNE